MLQTGRVAWITGDPLTYTEWYVDSRLITKLQVLVRHSSKYRPSLKSKHLNLQKNNPPEANCGAMIVYSEYMSSDWIMVSCNQLYMFSLFLCEKLTHAARATQHPYKAVNHSGTKEYCPSKDRKSVV